MITEEEYLHFLIKADITQAEYLFLHLLYKKRKDLIKLYKDHFPSEEKTMLSKWSMDRLIQKEYLIKTVSKDITTYKVGNKFLELFIDKHKATEEIYEIYPSYLTTQVGSAIALTTMDRNIFANIYENAIMGSYEEHVEILKDIEYAKEKELINMGIEKFLKSKYWKNLREQRVKNIDLGNTNSIQENDF